MKLSSLFNINRLETALDGAEAALSTPVTWGIGMMGATWALFATGQTSGGIAASIATVGIAATATIERFKDIQEDKKAEEEAQSQTSEPPGSWGNNCPTW